MLLRAHIEFIFHFDECAQKPAAEVENDRKTKIQLSLGIFSAGNVIISAKCIRTVVH